ncbi:hypothetical protein COX27_01125 [Candidatus Kuenenbacteria bacterium CG23_combo_of_CG06-09_8_20_14_all_36_9]|nr:MAG: hypothetical protein COX27_01125 [Candidatus Kuenenbacteria bacterium CG23_combo_of_CG06-09_8_20_14_all_36_9]
MNVLSQTKKISVLAQAFLFLSLTLTVFLLPKNTVLANTFNELIPLPVVEYPKNNAELVKPLTLSGLTISPTKVRVYLDNKSLGYAKNEIGFNGWLKFSLAINQNLEIGPHKIEFVADYYDKFSSATTTINITIVEKLRGPTLLAPVVNSETIKEQPWIVGVTPNDTQVEIYLDEQLNGLAEIKNDPNGTASFRYKPKQKLTPGAHTAKARVIDQNKNVSDFSNKIIIKITAPLGKVEPTVKGDESTGQKLENKILENKIIDEQNSLNNNWQRYLIGLIIIAAVAILVYLFIARRKNKNKQLNLFENKKTDEIKKDNEQIPTNENKK